MILIFLTLCVISGHTDTDSGHGKIFPKNWDTGGVFKDKHVLAWVQFKGLPQLWHFQVRIRKCFVTEIAHDSAGRPTYVLSEYISYQGLANEWELNFDVRLIHHQGRFSGSGMIFIDNIKTYSNRPDSSEVYSLLNEWGFTLNHKEQPTEEVVEGINSSLWIQVLNWKPNKAKLMNK